MSKTATILAVKAADLPDDPNRLVWDMPEQFHPNVWAGPRHLLEGDPTFRQIIPYIVVTNGPQVLAYTRAPSGGEGRLHNRVSIGVGGHVDASDSRYHRDGSINFVSTLDYAARRELGEELGIDASFASIGRDPFRQRGLIISHKNDVDKVHFGVLMTWDAGEFLAEGRRFRFEEHLGSAAFRTPTDLRQGADAGVFDLESWTEAALNILR